MRPSMHGHLMQIRLRHASERIHVIENIPTDEEMRRALVVRLQETHQLVCAGCWTIVKVHGDLAFRGCVQVVGAFAAVVTPAAYGLAVGIHAGRVG